MRANDPMDKVGPSTNRAQAEEQAQDAPLEEEDEVEIRVMDSDATLVNEDDDVMAIDVDDVSARYPKTRACMKAVRACFLCKGGHIGAHDMFDCRCSCVVGKSLEEGVGLYRRGAAVSARVVSRARVLGYDMHARTKWLKEAFYLTAHHRLCPLLGRSADKRRLKHGHRTPRP